MATDGLIKLTEKAQICKMNEFALEIAVTLKISLILHYFAIIAIWHYFEFVENKFSQTGNKNKQLQTELNVLSSVKHFWKA